MCSLVETTPLLPTTCDSSRHYNTRQLNTNHKNRYINTVLFCSLVYSFCFSPISIFVWTDVLQNSFLKKCCNFFISLLLTFFPVIHQKKIQVTPKDEGDTGVQFPEISSLFKEITDVAKKSEASKLGKCTRKLLNTIRKLVCLKMIKGCTKKTVHMFLLIFADFCATVIGLSVWIILQFWQDWFTSFDYVNFLVREKHRVTQTSASHAFSSQHPEAEQSPAPTAPKFRSSSDLQS